jgi:hypothetical protein
MIDPHVSAIRPVTPSAQSGGYAPLVTSNPRSTYGSSPPWR